MAEPGLSLCWKDHTSELATAYKSLLENNFLVDCTISAEGQSLKAHRLVLSACSPYFHMLFREETGKHAFIILLDASFETLKAVIDFVYRGEAQIPERNLKAFLTLAQSLQIKGIGAFSKDYKNKILSSPTTETASQGTCENNHITCEVQGNNSGHEKRHENYSQQHLHHLDGYTEASNTNSSVPFEGENAQCEELQSTSLMTPLPEHQQHIRNDEVSVDTEITVKDEPFYSVFLETRNEILDNTKSDESMCGNFTSEMGSKTTSVCGEEDMNLFSSCHEPFHTNVESSLLTTSQQKIRQLSNVINSGQDVAERDPLLPENLVPKSEHVDEDGEDPIDDTDTPKNDGNGASERKKPAYGEKNPGQCSSAGDTAMEQHEATWNRGENRRPEEKTSSSPPGLHLEVDTYEPHFRSSECSPASRSLKCTDVLPAENDQAKQLRWEVLQQRSSPPPPAELHEGHQSRQQWALSDEGCDAPAHFGDPTTHQRQKPALSLEGANAAPDVVDPTTHKGRLASNGPHRCEVCQKVFKCSSQLAIHMRSHTGVRPYHCDVCEMTFRYKITLDRHKRKHTRELPHRCDICGKTFNQKSNLNSHMAMHTGVRPYHCYFCEMTFRHKSTMDRHTRTHTGERPYRCDQCGKDFARNSTLAVHKRSHDEKCRRSKYDYS